MCQTGGNYENSVFLQDDKVTKPFFVIFLFFEVYGIVQGNRKPKNFYYQSRKYY